jgi:hypothetical protein
MWTRLAERDDLVPKAAGTVDKIYKYGHEGHSDRTSG